MTSSLVFKVRRQEPVLVAPAKPTPHEFKPLSDIDDQEGFYFHVPIIYFYPNGASPDMVRRDPAQVIREALAEALVFYYPFAGRLREWPGRKLVVECTGEGAMFIEADAEVSLDQFGDTLRPPFRCLDELLYDVPGSGGILNCPLILVQVTRLKCGGFVLALRFNHTMCDGCGMVQFLTAIAELARGEHFPSVPPVWDRHLLNAREPPRVTRIHREYEEALDPKDRNLITPLSDIVHRSFFFGPGQIAALRGHVDHSATRVEVLTASLWRCWTLALAPDPSDEVQVYCLMNARGNGRLQPPLPAGYYGNAVTFATAVSRASDLWRNPLGYAVELVRKAKSEATDEYVRPVADFMVLKGRPRYGMVRSLAVSDLTRLGFRDVDFGWGRAVYGAPAMGPLGTNSGFSTILIAFTNGNGEDGILAPIPLPEAAFERFTMEMERLVMGPMKEGGLPPHPISSL